MSSRIQVEKCGCCGLRYAERGGIFAGACSPLCWGSMIPTRVVRGKRVRIYQKVCEHCHEAYTPTEKVPSKWLKQRFCGWHCRNRHMEEYGSLKRAA